MLTNLIMAFFFIAAYYGLYCLIELIDVKFSIRVDSKSEIYNHMLTLMVKNAENEIEYTIRKLRHLSLSGMKNGIKIVVIDMGSTDNTLEILEKISQQNEDIEVLKFDEKHRIFEIFSNIN